jgi:hypothetical protein
MAAPEDHENRELANRLLTAADAIRHPGAVSLEHDLRVAAQRLLDAVPSTQPMLPALESELAKIANATSDGDTRLRLRRLLGEAQ